MELMREVISDDQKGIGLLTETNYWAFPQDGPHRQLLDGREVVMPPCRIFYQRATGELIFQRRSDELHRRPTLI
jgi:hypothetical protein